MAVYFVFKYFSHSPVLISTGKPQGLLSCLREFYMAKSAEQLREEADQEAEQGSEHAEKAERKQDRAERQQQIEDEEAEDE